MRMSHPFLNEHDRGFVGMSGYVQHSGVDSALEVTTDITPTSIVSVSTGQNLSVRSLDHVINWNSSEEHD